MDCYLGQIALFPYRMKINGWERCDGRTLQVREFQALFSLIQNRFGGDGVRTFNLPKLDWATPVCVDPRNPSAFALGKAGGSAEVQLRPEQMPAHDHAMAVSSAPGNASSFSGNVLSSAQTDCAFDVFAESNDLVELATRTTSVGAGQAHGNMQPYMVLAYYICMAGDYPPNPN